MTILGAILAGGRSQRFGSDKALAEIDGATMLDRIAAQLTPQCDMLVVVGREWAGLTSVSDLPGPGLGPLGGLAGALRHALDNGHSHVLTTGCDLPDLPNDLLDRLRPAPAVFRGQPLIGLWPAELADRLPAYLASTDDRSMRSWIAHARARRAEPPGPLSNINTQQDLAAYRSRRD